MKVAVINFSGNVGKTTIARHLLAPRIAGAEVVSIESINAEDGEAGSLRGSQYGKLKTWRIGHSGSFIDGVRISDVTMDDLDIPTHHSIRMRIGIDDKAGHPGGVNIFGKGFGNYDQDIVMRLHLRKNGGQR